MYPTSFENSNRRAASLRRTQYAFDRTSLDQPAQEPCIPAQAPTPDSNQMLVVECRTEDRWRVVLCTGLAGLDNALDTVRQLRRSDDIDGVCLSIEVSNHLVRESRREVLRFNRDDQRLNRATPVQGASRTEAEPSTATTADAQSSRSGYALDPRAAMDEASRGQSTGGEQTDIAGSPGAASQAISKSALCSERIPAFLREPIETEPLANGRTDRVVPETPKEPANPYDMEKSAALKRRPLSHPSSNSARNSTRDGEGWIDDLLARREMSISATTRDGETAHDDVEDAIDRLETPPFVKGNTMTAKILVFAGTVALLVLGGALAEFLTVDMTSAASAGSFFLN